MSACDDGPTLGRSLECTELSQSAAQVQAGMDAGEARLRVNLISRLGVDVASGETAETDGVELYGPGGCVRLATAATTRLGSVENDMGAPVADASVALEQITHVALLPTREEQGGRRFSIQRLELPTPVTLHPGSRTELFLTLEPVTGTDQVSTRFVAAGQVPLDAGAVMVYEPGRGATASMPGGFSLTLPPGSVGQPAVYGMVQQNVGGVSPMFNITPVGPLARAGRVTFAVDPARVPQGMSMSDFGARVGGVAAASSRAGNMVTVDVNAIGLTGMGTDLGFVELPDGTRMATAPAPDVGPLRPMLVDNECSRRLAAKRTEYLAMLARNHGLRLFECESVAPYVHLILVNIGYGGTSFPRVYLPAQWYSGTYDFILRTISEHANSVGAFAAVNGFTWDGGDGSAAGQTGQARGTVFIQGNRRSPLFSGAEALVAFANNTTTGTPATLIDKPSGVTSPNLGGYNYNVVPSTTSVVKYGRCSQPLGTQRAPWSTIGIGNGILVMASSVNGTETEAYELCAIYEGLNIMGGALRLDGNSAASIFWQGTHLNPLSGTTSWWYGSARRVAYGVAATN
ncbi:MAG TPA: hypothetical protein VHG93_14250 [Longimicrobium sp.]|nr:hypothetical protein [Longimicrobium sp.]